MLNTVNSRYSGHPRDRDLVSVKARVRNSRVRENFYFKPYLQKGVTCVFIFINSSTFFRPVVASKERQNFIYKQKRSYVPFVYSSSSKYVKNNHRMLQQCPHMHRFGFLLYWSTVIYISKKKLFSRKNLNISYWLHQLSHCLKISLQSALCTSPLNCNFPHFVAKETKFVSNLQLPFMNKKCRNVLDNV